MNNIAGLTGRCSSRQDDSYPAAADDSACSTTSIASLAAVGCGRVVSVDQPVRSGFLQLRTAMPEPSGSTASSTQFPPWLLCRLVRHRTGGGADAATPLVLSGMRAPYPADARASASVSARSAQRTWRPVLTAQL